MPMTHGERWQRRRKIAEYAKSHSDAKTSQKFLVTRTTVKAARKEFGVIKQGTQSVSPSGYAIIADLIRCEPDADVARKLGVTRQFVGQCKNKMKKYGVFDAVEDYIKKQF